MSFIEFSNVKKEYFVGDVTITAVKDCSFTIEEGELVVILGPSGAGKTTILNLLGGMDSPTNGKITVDGLDVGNLKKKELVFYRREEVGFVFQFYNLIANLTALENVELASQLCKDAFSPGEILTKVGLEERMNNFPSQLSGGEQQRVAIARAITKNPKILLCDEPTGALDSLTGQKIIDLLQINCRKMNHTTILITHNSAIAAIADKVIKVKNGTISEIILNDNPKRVDEIVW